MKNEIKNIIFAIVGLITLNACTYDYDMPDCSNAAPLYTIGGIPGDLRQSLIEDARKYGLTFEYAGEGWRAVVREKDDLGNVLYEGEPREKADRNATKLEISYICSCMLQRLNWNYYDICQFDFQNEFKLEISPYKCEVQLSYGDSYTVRVADNHPYIYNINYGKLPVIAIAESLGKSIAGVKTYITEKDAKGNQIRRFQHESIDGNVITVGAEYVDVEVEILGFSNYDKEVIGRYFFTNIPLAEINGTTLYLNTDMKHEFYLPSDGYTYNVGRSYFTPVLTIKVEELGLNIGDTKMYITEKDIQKNVLKVFPHDWVEGNVFTPNAEYIDVAIRLYKDDEIKGSFIFKDIKLSDVNNTTLELTPDMEYEFVLGY